MLSFLPTPSPFESGFFIVTYHINNHYIQQEPFIQNRLLRYFLIRYAQLIEFTRRITAILILILIITNLLESFSIYAPQHTSTVEHMARVAQPINIIFTQIVFVVFHDEVFSRSNINVVRNRNISRSSFPIKQTTPIHMILILWNTSLRHRKTGNIHTPHTLTITPNVPVILCKLLVENDHRLRICTSKIINVTICQQLCLVSIEHTFIIYAKTINIRMNPLCESLNVGVATGIILFCLK